MAAINARARVENRRAHAAHANLVFLVAHRVAELAHAVQFLAQRRHRAMVRSLWRASCAGTHLRVELGVGRCAISALPIAVEFRSIRRPIHETTRIGLAESIRSMITISLRSSTPMWTVSAVRCDRAASAARASSRSSTPSSAVRLRAMSFIPNLYRPPDGLLLEVAAALQRAEDEMHRAFGQRQTPAQLGDRVALARLRQAFQDVERAFDCGTPPAFSASPRQSTDGVIGIGHMASRLDDSPPDCGTAVPWLVGASPFATWAGRARGTLVVRDRNSSRCQRPIRSSPVAMTGCW